MDSLMSTEQEEKIAAQVLLVGLCPLIPIPILDDYVERQILASAIRRLSLTSGRPIPEEVIATLTEDRSSFLVGCLWACVRWPFKKLFRTVFFFLTIKDIVDTVSRTSHRVAIVAQAMERGLLPEQAERVRVEMDAALDKVSVSPVTRTVLRHEKREAACWQGEGTLPARAVAWAHRRGGGGVVVEKFLERVSALSSP